jgi:hypothetical protein
VSAPQVERATTDAGSDNAESSSGRVAGGLSTLRLNTLDRGQPWRATVRLDGVVQKKGTAAYAVCGPEDDVPSLGPWQEDAEATSGLSGVGVFEVSSPGA